MIVTPYLESLTSTDRNSFAVDGFDEGVNRVFTALTSY